jgi:Golgin subfamily A member 7/ERF4 family
VLNARRFYPVYPIELEGRITPTQWLDTVNGINEILISAHSLKRAALDHVLSVLTLYISSLILSTHYDKVSCGLPC